MSPTGPLLASLVWIVPALAQTEAAGVAPQIVLETVGPDGWRARFAPTNLGALLGSERGRGLWAPLLSPVLGWWQDALGRDAASAAGRERLLGYGGRVRAALWLDPERGDRITAAAIVLEGDGRTDLPALAADLRRLQGGLDGEWSTIDVAGARIDVVAHGADRFTAPIVGDGHLLCVLAGEPEIDRALAGGRAFAGTVEDAPPPPNAPALRIDVDAPALVAAARATATASGEGPTLAALGLSCLGRSQLAVAAAGPHVHVEFAQAFADTPRGLFAALFPTTEGLSALQRLLPEGAGSWLVGRFDALALYDAVEAVCAANDVDLDEMRAELRGELGVDLRGDLLQHLTDEVVLFGAPFADRPERTPWTLAFRLRDRAAFAPNLETALGKAKPWLSREGTVEHGEARLHRYGNMFGYDLWLATGADLFVIAGGEDCEARLTALFDRALAPVPDELPLPASFAALERHLPPGLQSAARGDLDSLAALPAAFWLGLAGGFGPRHAQGDFDEQQQQLLRELLAEHQLDTVRSAGGYADRCWRWRMFW